MAALSHSFSAEKNLSEFRKMIPADDVYKHYIDSILLYYTDRQYELGEEKKKAERTR